MLWDAGGNKLTQMGCVLKAGATYRKDSENICCGLSVVNHPLPECYVKLEKKQLAEKRMALRSCTC